MVFVICNIALKSWGMLFLLLFIILYHLAFNKITSKILTCFNGNQIAGTLLSCNLIPFVEMQTSLYSYHHNNYYIDFLKPQIGTSQKNLRT